MNIRVGAVMIAQSFPYCPMPISAKTITPAIPDAEHKPGEGSKERCY
jgi:hypothetical protein